MARGEGGRRVRMLAAIAVLSFTAPASAADLPLKPAPKAAPAANAQPAAAGSGPFAPPSPTCQEWTDGCRTCQRAPGGDAVCSNVGIACVSKAVTCTRP